MHSPASATKVERTSILKSLCPILLCLDEEWFDYFDVIVRLKSLSNKEMNSFGRGNTEANKKVEKVNPSSDLRNDSILGNIIQGCCWVPGVSR